MTLYLLHITIFKIIVRLQVLKVMTEYISYNKYLFKKNDNKTSNAINYHYGLSSTL